jgi:hypothetical protein
MNTTTIIVDIIHLSVLYLKHNISETGFCLFLQVVLTQFDPIDKESPCLGKQNPVQNFNTWSVL